jgi:hypothetical protein
MDKREANRSNIRSAHMGQPSLTGVHAEIHDAEMKAWRASQQLGMSRRQVAARKSFCGGYVKHRSTFWPFLISRSAEGFTIS